MRIFGLENCYCFERASIRMMRNSGQNKCTSRESLGRSEIKTLGKKCTHRDLEGGDKLGVCFQVRTESKQIWGWVRAINALDDQ